MRRKTKRVLKLRALRRAHEMTLEELARRTGLSKSFLCEIEKGYVRPSLSNAEALAAIFGVTVDEAFKFVEVATV